MAGAKPTKPSSRKAAGAASRKTALQLHIEGHTFEVIGKRIGVSRQRAHKMVQEQLAEAAAERSKLAMRALDTDLERVDFVMRSLAPKVEKGDDKAAIEAKTEALMTVSQKLGEKMYADMQAQQGAAAAAGAEGAARPADDLRRALAVSTAKQTAHDRGGLGL